jgi:hypothetical protein
VWAHVAAAMERQIGEHGPGGADENHGRTAEPADHDGSMWSSRRQSHRCLGFQRISPPRCRCHAQGGLGLSALIPRKRLIGAVPIEPVIWCADDALAGRIRRHDGSLGRRPERHPKIDP